MFKSNEDTITALITPAGVGAVSVIRVSGKNFFPVIEKVFKGKRKISEVESHTIHYGKFYSNDNNVIDDVLVSVFHSPNSYTGEDVIEVSTHGSPLITEKIIDRLLKEEIRIAEPGEFTKRAFLNGKLDLSQAEAVADIINSRVDASLRGARNQMDGLLSAKIDDLRTQLINTSSLVELELDFAEEDIQFLTNTEIIRKIDFVLNEVRNLISTYSFGKVLKDGVNIALVGKPNVGKSSLLNYLVKESRAIVSEIPGTTRDVIREEISIDGYLFRLYDTAGIRLTEDVLEKEGVSRSREAITNSDLVIFINEVDSDIDRNLYNEILQLNTSDNLITVFNKIDLQKESGVMGDVMISAKTGEGISDLINEIKRRVIGTNSYTENTAIITNVRHKNSLEKASEYLGNARESATNNFSGEFIATDLRNAESSLSEIIGRVTSDDILNNIFAKFCIGK